MSVTSVRRLFGILLMAIALIPAVACTQFINNQQEALTMPSSVSSSASSNPVTPQVGPGASYDATGSWHEIVMTLQGEVIVEHDPFVTQDSSGNLSFTAGGTHFAGTRLGTGRTIAYSFSVSFPSSPCELSVNGPGLLDTSNDSMTIRVQGVVPNCSHANFVVTLTRNP